MLLLFRKLRNSLLKQNKLATYFLYAIGEILLVVIGILIAVSIDNGNENRKNKHKINTAIEFLMKELTEDSIKYEATISFIDTTNIRIDEWIEKVENRGATLDTIIYVMRYEFDGKWTVHNGINNTAYQNMRNSGIFELLPDSIKVQVDDYYKEVEDSNRLMEIYNDQYREQLQEYVKTYSINNTNKNLISTTIWSDINPKHFLPRVRWLLLTKRVLFQDREKFSKSDFERSVKLSHYLKTYQKKL